MKLSTRGRYGVRAMLELALQQGGSPTALQELAQRQGISAKYLEQLLIPLKAAGLVNSVRGAKGGYLLAMSPEKVSLYDIVKTLEKRDDWAKVQTAEGQSGWMLEKLGWGW